MKKFIVICLLGLSILGCNSTSKEKFNLANPPSNPPGGGGNGGGVEQQDLGTKSFSEVMALKYNRAELVCSLWVMLSGDLDLQRVPNDMFRFNLKVPFSFPIRFNLGAGIRGVFGNDRFRELHRADVSFSVYKINIRDSFSIDNAQTQTRYDFLYSPEIGFSSNAVIRTYMFNEEVVQTFPRPEDYIHEKVDTEVINFTSDAIPNNFGFQTRDYVKCTIETEIRPEYQHHFRVNGIVPIN